MSVAPVTIRPALLADAAVLANLSGELGYATSTEQMTARLHEVLGNPGHAVFVAQTDLAEVLGWVHVYRYLVLEAEPRAEIGGLVTATTHRRRGVGRFLMVKAEAWARQQGLATLGLRSNTKRTEAHAFYAALGYEQTKAQFSFRKAL